ncbi:prohibitin family protein, partial [Candidatus Obscuribacterales bacterium]|nr:prohibitin family protein [Candidatus Obscuribacterales bacterium]
IAIPLVIAGWNSVQIVPRGYVGATSLFGVMNPQPLAPGFNIVNPLSRVDLLQTFVNPKKAAANSGSHDLQKVTTVVTVPYNLIDSQAPVFYREYGTIANFEAAILDPAIQESVKAVTANFTATDLVKKRETVRDEIESTIRAHVAASMKSKGAPGSIQIGRATLDNLDFTPKFAAAIEAKVKAGQDAERARNEGAKMVAEAEGEAQSIRAKAEAEAYSTVELAKKEADAIKREAAALRANPDLVELTAISRWKGKLPKYSGTMPVPMLTPSK